jgi:hypothetical protein
VLHNLFIVAVLIAVTIALTSVVILIAGARERAARDGGVDGVIYEDKLGLDTVCVQAKRLSLITL